VSAYYVYIMASRSRVLYTGVTDDLAGRVEQHKTGATVGFTGWYNVTRLVYFETFPDIRDAIAREKRIKGWTRAKKMHLIQNKNPHWTDLARDWFPTPRIRP
jgi:putative endonuclease